MSMLLLVPPVAFTIILIVVWALSTASGTLSLKRKGPRGALDKPYAGGEDVQKHRFQPDYGQFFPFAFFFTIMHVVTLIVATSPARTLESFSIAAIYVLGALLGLVMLFRR
ncbi:MAG TPA: hypothetical protein VL354_03385 [Spirochaetia bacterium]|nr:hypothetical protein [Spirochaetia bacterium]